MERVDGWWYGELGEEGGKGRRARIWLGVTWWRWRQQEGGRERERGEGGETARAQSVTVGVAFSLVRWPRAGSWWGRRGSGRVGRVRGAPPCSCGRPCGVYVLFSRELIFKLSFSLSLSLSLSPRQQLGRVAVLCAREQIDFFFSPFLRSSIWIWNWFSWAPGLSTR
jgi:hypothetical protein